MAKQWFDFDRNTFSFIKKVNSSAQVFTYTSDFDDNGILYWIGTNGRYRTRLSVGLEVRRTEGRDNRARIKSRQILKFSFFICLASLRRIMIHVYNPEFTEAND